MSVLLVGGLVLAPASSRLLDGDTGATGPLIAGATYDVVALTLATVLAVYKPGRTFRRIRDARR